MSRQTVVRYGKLVQDAENASRIVGSIREIRHLAEIQQELVDLRIMRYEKELKWRHRRRKRGRL